MDLLEHSQRWPTAYWHHAASSSRIDKFLCPLPARHKLRLGLHGVQSSGLLSVMCLYLSLYLSLLSLCGLRLCMGL